MPEKLLNEIKLSMRLTNNALDDDIKRNIDACLLDLERVGVDKSKETELLNKACELYVKWQYDYQLKGDRYQKNYELLRDSMSLAEKYKEQSNV